LSPGFTWFCNGFLGVFLGIKSIECEAVSFNLIKRFMTCSIAPDAKPKTAAIRTFATGVAMTLRPKEKSA